MTLKKITANAVKNKRVLLKVDYNAPTRTNKNKIVVMDDTRLKATLPTIEFLIEQKARIIITSHFGRPGGKVIDALRLDPIAKHLEKLTGKKIKKIDIPAGPEAETAVDNLQPGEILMLENSRFHPGEKKNDSTFAKELSKLADVYVNDAFSSSHREHSSVVGITKHLPSYAGFALFDEVEMLKDLVEKPKRPFVAIVGGAKISDKVEAIRNLSKVADVILVGGGVANNFIKADGLEVFHSYLEDEPADIKKKNVSFVAVAEELIHNTKSEKMLLHGYIPLPKIIYPSDVIAADDMENPKEKKVIDLTNGNNHERKKSWMYLDIGPRTQRLFRDIILEAQTVFWNGPMGVFEQKDFEEGTKSVATAIAKSSAKTIIGGGDTISAIHQLGLEDRYDYISAAGGAALEFLGGNILPGLKPLQKS
ncbi:MAG: phosphoglycerate kinase [Candidatus Pacebacteria bacterium]|jgi:phosphoglycerate kinase|nr:phosphoglycerate kinase [Candidatus Paceibacterota bacterium]MBT4651941.1 phosphoglycerate kinase [Candidatus Paceibacterota bacterium]MBT6755963.1 phosphoglycerate kinase [Candidatus Paceibacterota bacterium]MBT6920844.1 phosphoglycerate kinase [Candidatus Paceibacterota bacterium]